MDDDPGLLPAGEAGRVLDRLPLPEQVIGPQHVRQALEDTRCFDCRCCRLTREVIDRQGLVVRVIRYTLDEWIGHFVVRPVMAEAAAAGSDPDGLSFVGCLQVLRCRLPECPEPASLAFAAWYRGLLWEVSRERADDAVRRNRINPRVVRVKMSKFKKKRPEHRPVPPLTKTFRESVVMLR